MNVTIKSRFWGLDDQRDEMNKGIDIHALHTTHRQFISQRDRHGRQTPSERRGDTRPEKLFHLPSHHIHFLQFPILSRNCATKYCIHNKTFVSLCNKTGIYFISCVSYLSCCFLIYSDSLACIKKFIVLLCAYVCM